MPTLLHIQTDLERHLLQRGVGALEAGRAHCHRCRRTPLVGERVHIYGARMLCALCRRTRADEPDASELVRSPEFGHAVRIRDQRAVA
jgi:hypothetical protein